MPTIDAQQVLQKAMSTAGYDPVEFAHAIGMHPGTVARWLSGKTRPTERRVHDALLSIGEDPVAYGIRLRAGSSPPPLQSDPPAWFLAALEQQNIAREQQTAHLTRQIRDLHDLVADIRTRI